MIDTHAHIYSEEFDADREKVIERALKRGIEHIILPNIDLQSLQPMLQLEASHPDICHAAIGLHQDMRTTFDSYDWNLRKELKKSEAYKRIRPIVKTKRLGA